MTDEEIKKISTEYAESNIPNGIDEEYARCVVFHDSEMFGKFLQWLSKNYCLVEKSKVKEVYDNHIDRIKGGSVYINPQIETYMRASLASAMWRLFGKDMFEEE